MACGDPICAEDGLRLWRRDPALFEPRSLAPRHLPHPAFAAPSVRREMLAPEWIVDVEEEAMPLDVLGAMLLRGSELIEQIGMGILRPLDALPLARSARGAHRTVGDRRVIFRPSSGLQAGYSQKRKPLTCSPRPAFCEQNQGLALEPQTGLEPVTYGLRNRCSTN